MATLEQVHDVVIKFAKQTSSAITPVGATDPIVPAPHQMTDETYKSFYFGLLHALADGNITAKVGFEQLRHCKTWFDVCIVVWHSQG